MQDFPEDSEGVEPLERSSSYINSNKSTPTRKDLRDIAFGNITIEEILNRARFDDSFQVSKFAALVEKPSEVALCYYYTWESGTCKYGDRCRYIHNPDIMLRSLGDIPACAKGPMVPLVRRPLEAVIDAWLTNTESPHKVAYIEFQGKVVWFREGGKSSRSLWDKCLSQIAKKRSQLRAIASSVGGLDTQSQASIPDSIKQLELLGEENFGTLFSFLDISDIFNFFLCIVGNYHVREDACTALLSPIVWEHAIASKWNMAFTHVSNPVQGFLDLRQSTINAHTCLVSSTMGLFTHSSSLPDPHPATGVKALMELPLESSPGKTILVSEDGNAVCDVRFTDSLIALCSGHEVSIFRSGDLVKVSTCKQRLGCDRVTIPETSEGNVLVHAGHSGIFLRDLHEPNLAVLKRISVPETFQQCLTLDAVQHSVFVGYTGCGLARFSSESAKEICRISEPSITTSRMWSEKGTHHMFLAEKSLFRWDIRVKDPILIRSFSQRPISLGNDGSWGEQTIAVGHDSGCDHIDLRTASPVWVIDTMRSPVSAVSVAKNVVSLFHGSPHQIATSITAYDLQHDASNPLLLGHHDIPFRVSAVGRSASGAQKGSGCVFAVTRPKRSGRGDNGILCIGGNGFITGNRRQATWSQVSNTSRRSSDATSRRISRDFTR